MIADGGKLREGLRDFSNWDVVTLVSGYIEQRFFGDVAEVPMFAIDRGELVGGLAGEVGNKAIEHRAANAEDAFLMPGKGTASEENGSVDGVVETQRLEKVGDKTSFFEFFRRVGDSVGSLGEKAHGFSGQRRRRIEQAGNWDTKR